MSDHDDDNMVMPPTPGRTLNILPVREKSSGNSSNKAKRKLDLDTAGGTSTTDHTSKKGEDITTLSQLQKKLKPFTIPKKDKSSKSTSSSSSTKDNTRDSQQPVTKKPKIDARDGPRTKTFPSIKSDIRRSQATKSPERTSGQSSSEERRIAKRLKTQAWSNILKHKRKLYVPHTSDPRLHEVDIKKETGDLFMTVNKENSSITVNVLATATILSTPVKITDHNSIIKFMSITPQLLSPLSDHPRMFK